MKGNHLDWASIHGSKGSAQGFMTSDDVIEALLQHCHIKRTRYDESPSHIVGRVARLQLVYKPELLLGK